MKTLALPALLVCLGAATASASPVTFTLTASPFEVIDTGNSHFEEVWNFTTLPGWSPYLTIESVEITETFTAVPGSTFSSTIIPYDTTTPNTESASYVVFPGETVTSTKTITLDVPSELSLADISNGGVVGEFDTRVSRYNAGEFLLDTITITIDAETPEPATFALLGLGLAGIALLGRRRMRARG